jgi:hypothetical protein
MTGIRDSILSAIGNTSVVRLRSVVAALQLARERARSRHTVATVAVDTGRKYLAGDLFELSS